MSLLVTISFQDNADSYERSVRRVRASARLAGKPRRVAPTIARVPKSLKRQQNGEAKKKLYQRVSYGQGLSFASSLPSPSTRSHASPSALSLTSSSSELNALHSTGVYFQASLAAELSEPSSSDDVFDPSTSLFFRLTDDEIRSARARISESASNSVDY